MVWVCHGANPDAARHDANNMQRQQSAGRQHGLAAQRVGWQASGSSSRQCRWCVFGGSVKKSDDEAAKKVDDARVANTKPSLALASCSGTYSDKMYGDVTIAEENGKLVMRFLSSPNFVADLEHWHYDTFVIKWRPSVAYNFPRGFVTFTIDKNAKTDKLIVDQPNNDFWFYELDPHRAK